MRHRPVASNDVASPDHEEPSIWIKAADQFRHCLRVRRRRHDDPRTAYLSQFLGCVCGTAVDIHIRAKLASQRLVFRPAPDCGHSVAELVGELESEVAEPANAFDCHNITGHARNSAAEENARAANSNSFSRSGRNSRTDSSSSTTDTSS